jgi:dipeptidyl aminopeptidase/acylaminoacyl peptidase
MKKIFAAIALITPLVMASPSHGAARTIQLDDLKSISGVSEPAISPDGQRIAFVLSKPDYKADKTRRTLMLYDLHTNAQRPLTFERKGLGSPAWSPDGTRIAFLAVRGEDKDAREQVFVMDMRGGDAMPVTDASEDVQQFAWRPDGNAIAYVAADTAPNKKQIEHHLDAFVVGDQSYKETEAPQPSHIWLETLRDGDFAARSERLTSGSWSVPPAAPPSSPSSPLSWSPDGRYIVFSKMATPYYADGDRTQVCVLDVQSKAIRTLTAHGHFEGYGQFSPDGTKIAYWYPYHGDPAGQNDIMVTSAQGGDGEDITAGDIDTNVQRAMWMPDSKALLISGHRDTDAALWIKPLDGKAQRIQLGDVQPTQPFWLDASMAKTGAIAFTASEPHQPTELYYLASPDAAPKRLTAYNDAVATLDLGAVKAITWQNDGYHEDGVVTFPPGYDASKPYPLVLVIHGGPNSASLTSFSMLNQLLAARGFIVFNPNYRGSDNLGEAYWHAIFNDAGAGPGHDVMAGITAVEKMANVDKNRVAVSGWSYGGYMTSWMEGHYHIWKAAVAGAAVNNWIDEYALSDNNVSVRFSFGGSPWTGKYMDAYRAQSPIAYAWDINTPTLILSDTGDARVPITQSYEMYHALKDHGVPVRFFAYPVSGHFPGDPVRSLDVDRRWIDWLANYLK